MTYPSVAPAGGAYPINAAWGATGTFANTDQNNTNSVGNYAWGAADQTFNGELYYGGAATASYANTPGGGGAMGPFYPPINYPGAAGAVFFLAYQV